MARKIQKSLEFTAKLKGEEWHLKFNTKDCNLIEVGNLLIGQLRKVCEENNTSYIELIEHLINGEDKQAPSVTIAEGAKLLEGEVIETVEVK